MEISIESKIYLERLVDALAVQSQGHSNDKACKFIGLYIRQQRAMRELKESINNV